jgi:hypothetical protein
VRKLLEIALGILTAIGGFVDIGDLVASAETGARFGLGLAWVLLVGVVGIVIYAEMAGRVASVSGRSVFDLVRAAGGGRPAGAGRARAGGPGARPAGGGADRRPAGARHRIRSIRDHQIRIAGTADDLPAPQPSGD